MAINWLEGLTILLYLVGLAAGLSLLVQRRSLLSATVFVLALFLPILGSSLAIVAFLLHWRSTRTVSG